MNINKKLIVLTLFCITLVIVGLYYLLKPDNAKSDLTSPEESINLTISSTSPSPLEEATISPSQPIEISFNKPFSKSEFKYKLDPEIEHEVSVVSGQSSDFGDTFRITFKKPLELGASFTLFINPETKVDDKQKLDKEYIYHIRTIGYKGV